MVIEKPTQSDVFDEFLHCCVHKIVHLTVLNGVDGNKKPTHTTIRCVWWISALLVRCSVHKICSFNCFKLGLMVIKNPTTQSNVFDGFLHCWLGVVYKNVQLTVDGKEEWVQTRFQNNLHVYSSDQIFICKLWETGWECFTERSKRALLFYTKQTRHDGTMPVTCTGNLGLLSVSEHFLTTVSEPVGFFSHLSVSLWAFSHNSQWVGRLFLTTVSEPLDFFSQLSVSLWAFSHNCLWACGLFLTTVSEPVGFFSPLSVSLWAFSYNYQWTSGLILTTVSELFFHNCQWACGLFLTTVSEPVGLFSQLSVSFFFTTVSEPVGFFSPLSVNQWAFSHNCQWAFFHNCQWACGLFLTTVSETVDFLAVKHSRSL